MDDFNKFINDDICNGISYLRVGISNMINDIIQNNATYNVDNIPYSLIEQCVKLKGFIIRTNMGFGKFTSVVKDSLNNELIKIEGNIIDGTTKFRSLIS